MCRHRNSGQNLVNREWKENFPENSWKSRSEREFFLRSHKSRGEREFFLNLENREEKEKWKYNSPAQERKIWVISSRDFLEIETLVNGCLTGQLPGPKPSWSHTVKLSQHQDSQAPSRCLVLLSKRFHQLLLVSAMTSCGCWGGWCLTQRRFSRQSMDPSWVTC